MQPVKIADLKNNLSRHLNRVRQGEPITVLDRDTPVARLIPFVHGERTAASTGGAKAAAAGSGDRVADLARQGVLTPGDPHAIAKWMVAHPAVTRPAGAPMGSDVLLQMRRNSTR